MRRTLLFTVLTCIGVLVGIFLLSRPHRRLDSAPNFSAWLEAYRAGRADPTEGVTLARQRRAELLQLIQTDPAKALEAAVPAAMRVDLPREIVAELETPFDAIGDLNVYCALRARTGPHVEPTRRFVTVEGQKYHAHLYGRRAHQTTKLGIPLRGIALDGHAAVDENALQPLTAAEALSTGKPITDLAPLFVPLTIGTFAELDNHIYKFASPDQLQQAEARIRAAEGTLDAVPQISAERAIVEHFDVAGIRSANTEGNKRVLIIRVDFSDKTGDAVNPFNNTVATAANCQNLMDTVIGPYYLASSYSITSLTTTVSTKLYRMPQTGNFYAVNGADDQLHADAQNLASADYTLANFDRLVVVFPDSSGFAGSQTQYAGLADLGGPKVWINGYFDFATLAHELGHTYGLEHANLWKVNDGNPISSSGHSDEYGDDFDTMGGNFTNDLNVDFNPWFKRTLNWLPSAGVTNVTQAGTYRVTRIDGGTNSGTLALTIKKDSSRTYWITCRRKITSSQSIQTGAYIIWGYNFNQQSNLLDFITPGNNDLDAPLPLNTNFHDSALNLNILPVANGGTAPNEYIDIQISFGNATVSTTTVASDATAAFAASVQNVPLSATVTPASSGPVNEGTVAFQIRDGGTDVGTAVISPVNNGNASVSYPLPGGTAPKTYTIVATYSGGTTFTGSLDSTKSLSVSAPTTPTFVSPPIALPTSPSAGQLVTFTAAAISDPADTLTYTWNFGDGADGSGGTTTHVFAAAGTYPVSCTVTNGKGGMDTVMLNVVVHQPVYGTGIDSDGDGFSDTLEAQFNTNPNDPASNPLGLNGPVPMPTALSLTGVQLKINFIKPSVDTFTIRGTLPAATGLNYANKLVYVAIGPKADLFTLDIKGHSTPKALESLVCTKPARGFTKFTAKGTKIDLATLFAPVGVTAATPTNTPLVTTVTVFFNGVGYRTPRTLIIKSNKKAATLK